MELLLKHVIVSLNLTNIHILIITTWSKTEKEVKCFALQTQARLSVHSQWLQKTVKVREKMVLIEFSFWSTHPVCPRSAAWWSAPLPLVSFWFILAPFCKKGTHKLVMIPWGRNIIISLHDDPSMKELQVLSIAESQQKESNLPLRQTGEVLFFVHLPHLPSLLWLEHFWGKWKVTHSLYDYC